MVRDAQRSRVYAAEDFVRTLFDRSSSHGAAALDFFGASITLPAEARFGSVESVQRYVDEVLGMPAVRSSWPDVGGVAVRSRRGNTAAHYERVGDEATIAVPDRSTAWALRELVVLHELAHHLSPTQPAHGPEFTTTFRDLAGAVMGPEVAYVLTVVYAKEGVR